MNPCRRYRKSLALLAASFLEAEEAASVRNHLEGCPACRARLVELRALCESHARAAQQLPEAEAVPGVYRGVLHRISAREAWWGEALRAAAASWRLRLACLATVAVLLVMLLPRSRSPRPLSPAPPPPAPSLASRVENSRPGAKLIVYQLAAHRSLEELDAMLSREAARHAFAPPSYTPRHARLEPEL